MHILLIHQAFASSREPGGTRHYELARYLVKEGHQVTIVASNVSYLTGQRITANFELFRKELLDGIRVLRVYALADLHRSFAWRVVSFFSFMFTSTLAAFRTRQVDLVMGTSPPIFQAVSAWLVAKIRCKPFLLEIRDLWPEFAIGMGVLTNPVLIRLSRRLEKFLYSQTNHFLVNSPAYKAYLTRKDIPSEKIDFIPNGVDTGMFNPSEKGEKTRSEFNLNGKFVVTYAGALGLANDIPTILRAAERLREQRNIVFLFVGDGKERKNLEAIAKQKDLTNVMFIGSLSKSKMPEVLAASDICIATLQNIPMFKTTYPNKIFDYMAAGKPTILGIDGVIREVIETSKGGVFVPPGNDAALANAVKALERNAEDLKAMGLSARNYVVKHFDRQKQAKQFLNLIQRFR